MMDRTVERPAPGARPAKARKGVGGAAAAYLALVIVTLLFIVGVYFLYTRAEHLQEELDTKTNEWQGAKDELARSKKRIDTLFSDYLGFPDEQALNAALTNEAGEKKTARALLEERESRIAELGHLLSATRSELKDAQADRDTAIAQREENDRVRNEEVEKLQDDIAQLQDEIEKQRAELEKKIREESQLRAEAEMRLARAEEKWESVRGERPPKRPCRR